MLSSEKPVIKVSSAEKLLASRVSEKLTVKKLVETEKFKVNLRKNFIQEEEPFKPKMTNLSL